MKQSKLNLPNALPKALALPKLGESFFVFVHPTSELVFFSVILAAFSLFVKQSHTTAQSMTATSTSLVAISDVATTAMLNNAWSVWKSSWFGHDLGPLDGVNKGQIDIKY